MEPLRHIRNRHFGAVFFRRTSPQITAQGGLWTESGKIYPLLGAKPNLSTLHWTCPAGARVKFSHLQYESDIFAWQGSQIPLIAFDELTPFSQAQFFYLLTRNRSTCGVRPYIRATTNPDADSWVADFIAWWIDQETGYPISERAGKVRWFVRIDEQLHWADTEQELLERFAHIPGLQAKSVTFVPAKVTDNQILLKADPGYLANLMAQPLVERERLLGGNWKIRHAAGKVFKRHWFPLVDAVPADARLVRYWDLAATKPKPTRQTQSAKSGPDYTVGLLLAEKQGIYWIVDIQRIQGTPKEVEDLIRQTAELDGRRVSIWIEQEPGSSGVKTIDHYVRTVLNGWPVRGMRTTGS